MSDGDCRFCGHRMLDHHWFRGNYEEPEPWVECCDETISPETLTQACRCSGRPDRWPADQLAAIDAEQRSTGALRSAVGEDQRERANKLERNPYPADDDHGDPM